MKINKEDILFSIIMPCYNYGIYLSNAIESVLAQNHHSFEIILVDDASTDNTHDIGLKYGNNIRYMRLPVNKGAAGAWSEGIKIAEGKYLCKLDADDWQLPGFLSTMEREFESNSQIGIVACSTYVFHKGATIKTDYITDKDKTIDAYNLRKKLLEGFPFRVPGTCILKKVLLSQGVPLENLYQVHDWEFFLRCLKGWQGRFIHKPLAMYRIHEKSITHTARRDDILYKDFIKWITESKRTGNSFLTDHDRNILMGSMAILLMREKGRPFGLKSFVHVLITYFRALLLAINGGFLQLTRFHAYLVAKAMKFK
jgi:glycosyltransferase involved in cell wall biosynthesis